MSIVPGVTIRFSQEMISVDEPIGMRDFLRPLMKGVGQISGLPALPIPAIRPFFIPMSACGQVIRIIFQRGYRYIPCKYPANQ